MKRRLVTIALSLVTLGVLFTVGITPALAHALLLRSIPDANAALDRSPAQVELFMSEGLDSSFSKIKVLNSSGKTVDAGDSRVDPADTTHMTVSLPSLPDGVYTVAWQALSSTDGHVTTGTFPFAVGNVDAAELAAAAQASAQVKLPLGQVASAWLTILAAALLAGGNLFVLVVYTPASRALAAEGGAGFQGTGGATGAAGSARAAPPWDTLLAVALAVFVFAIILALLVEGGQVSGQELAAPWSTTVNGVMFQTRYGTFWLGQLALILLLAALLLPAAQGQAVSPRRRWLAVAAGAGLLALIALGSHEAAEPDPLLPTLSDWVHLMAASAWIGGLVFFATSMWVGRRDTDAAGQPLASRLTANLLPRFSLMALISVDVLTLTGLYMAILSLGSWNLLVTTLYGQALLVKLAIAAVMVGMGAVNLLWTTPGMKRAASAASAGSAEAPVGKFFRRFLTTEMSLGITLLLAVGVLVNLPPAKTNATAPELTAKATVNDLNLVITIDPGRVGLNTFTLHVTSGGKPVVGAKQVALRFTPTIANLAPSQAILQDMGNGNYSAKGAYFSLPDNWQVQAVVRRDNQFDAFANFNFPLGGVALPAIFPWNRVSGGLLLLAAVFLYFSTRGLTTLKRLGQAGAIVPAVALCAVGLVVYYQTPPSLGTGPVNPIPPNTPSVNAGHALFTTNCVPCHGVSGHGDGPVGLTLNPHPADLTLHAVPGVHTDGQLYSWITNGYPGSVMPSFKNVLSDNDRWNLVNYIRTLAPH